MADASLTLYVFNSLGLSTFRSICYEHQDCDGFRNEVMDIGIILQSTRCEILTRHALHAVVALWAVDWLQTLPLEVEMIWPSPWNFVKVLFLLNRYFPIDVIGSFLYLNVANPNTCMISNSFGGVASVLGVAMAEAVIFLRLYALSGQGAWMKIWLYLQFFLVQIAALAMVGLFLASLEYADSPFPNLIPCFPVAGKPVFPTAFFGLIMATETCRCSIIPALHPACLTSAVFVFRVSVVLLVTLYITVNRHRRSRSPLVNIFYRDGLIYFIALAGS
ncbi:hypothetical protein MD484_g6039, partial [Candolleomyces efflorescens]